MNKSISLAISDMKNIRRDFISLVMLIVPIYIGLILRFLPNILELFPNFTMDITPYYPFAVGFFIVFSPMVYGMLIGFRILDERDENLIAYFAITPITKKGYISFRIISPMILCFILSFAVIFIPNLIEIKISKVLPAIFLASLQTPITALFMGSIANNKLEGLAVGKFFSIINFTPIAVLFTSRWKYLAGLAPQFWITELFLKSYNNMNIFIPFFLGLLVTGLWIFVLFRVFNKKIK